MSSGLVVASSELILGGQRSGKLRRAEMQALTWLAQAQGGGDCHRTAVGRRDA